VTGRDADAGAEGASALRSVHELPALPIWEGVVARRIDGERLTLAVVELEPNAVVPEHRHPNEQFGLVIEGSLRFTIGDETRDLTAGGTWAIPSDVPHTVTVGPDGAILVDVFSPPRRDWDAVEPDRDARPTWPGS